MPNDSRARFAADDLRTFTTRVFASYGVPDEDAELGATVLIDADLAGIESHGIAHLPWHGGYAPGLERGTVKAKPDIKVLRESAVSAAWDADGGLGVVAAPKAMGVCIEKAEANGIGMVTVANGRHFGAAGCYARMAADRGLIGMAMCNVAPIAVAAGGLDRVYGTNPIAFAAPIEADEPFLLDIATTAVAAGKLEIAQRQGKRIPPGWAVNGDGTDSDDPLALRTGGALLPLGSHLGTSSYKGYGLGLMVDTLTGMLSGAGSGLFFERGMQVQGFWFSAWRIDLFREPAEFKAEMKRVVDQIRATRPIAGVERVLIPGDPEHTARRDRMANGVPLDVETVEQLSALGKQRGVDMPPALNR